MKIFECTTFVFILATVAILTEQAFAQVDVGTAVTSANNILADRSDAMVILVGVILLCALWIWKIHLPQKQSEQKLREADKEIHATNAQTLSELTKMTSKIDQTTSHSNNTVKAMAEVKGIELDCIDQIAQKVQCDITSKTAEARGVLRAVRIGATE
jgi:hypothetical protein